LQALAGEMESEIRPDFEEAIAELRLEDLETRAQRANGGRPLPLRDWVTLAEAWRIAQALREARGNRSAAARALGIGRRTLYSKMEKLGLTPVWLVPRSAHETGPSGTASENGASNDLA
jgi:DNA-binding NtrC family response regulator